MRFQIDFNTHQEGGDNFLINILGAEIIETGSVKYPPFQLLYLEVRDFEHLREILKTVDNHFGDYYSAVVSFDSATIYLDNKI